MPATNREVTSIGRGLYLGSSPLSLPTGALEAGKNFRVKQGRLENLNLGWDRFGDFQLDGPVTLIDNFFARGQDEVLIFATLTDLYKYNTVTEGVEFLSPRYETGTASRVGTDVTGIGTNWQPDIKAGDYIHFGFAGETDPAAVWHLITGVTADTTLATATSGAVADGPYTIRRTLTMQLVDWWDTDIFVRPAGGNDLWFATNGSDPVITWDGIADQVTFNTALGFTCKTLVNFSNMLIYGNLTQASELLPTDIINSDAGDPLNVTTGISEQFTVHGGTDEILHMLPLGDSLNIYSERTMVQAQFVGDPLVFLFRVAISGIGPIGANAVADFGDYHTLIGQDAKYRFDGITVEAINMHVWRELIRTIDPSRASMSFHIFDEEQGDLIWSIPFTTDAGSGDDTAAADEAYVEHYLEDVPSIQLAANRTPTPFSHRDFPFTAGGHYERQSGLTWAQLTDEWQNLNFRWNDKFFALAFPLSLVGDVNGFVYTISTSQNKLAADGVTPVGFDSYVRFARQSLIDGRMRGLLTRVYPYVTLFANSELDVAVLMADHAAGPYTVTDTQVFDQSLLEGGHFTTHYRRGRFFSCQIGTDGLNLPWELSGYSYDVRAGGMR